MSTQNEGLNQGAIGEATLVASPVVKYMYMKQEVKLGSRKIQIVRVEHSFSILPKGAPAKAIRDEVTIKLGSEWKHGTRDIVRGLNREEEAKYLPQLIGLNGPKSEKWEEKALEHWANFGFTLPNNDVGIELEIGFKLDENSEVVPINLEDYIKYNWAIGLRKQVIGEYDDNILPQHVARIIDKGKKQDEKEQLFAKLKDVNRDFLKLIRSDDPKDRDKIDWILETMGGPEGDGLIITSLSPIQREMELEKVKEKNINKFSEILSDQFLELKATIRKAISYGVSQLKLEGNTYFYGNVALGELDGAIGYFSDPSHVRERQVLNEAVKQSKK